MMAWQRGVRVPAKHLILVHGRAIKPSASALAALAKRAIIRGLERAGQASAALALDGGAIRFSSVYYGDINNEIEASHSRRKAALLTAANDPGYRFKPCFPAAELEAGFALTDAIPKFTAATYRKVLNDADDWRFLDEAADVASLFGRLLTFGILNTAAVDLAGSDMAAYLTSQVIGSEIRDRLRAVLEPSLLAGDDICLVTHSLGCMVAYDLFWKYSFRSEYQHVRAAGKAVRLWLTIGCPLGEMGVQKNLLDGSALDSEKYPRNQFLDWVNIHAADDVIAHVESMRRAFAVMQNRGYCREISDRKIYNCWIYRDAINGHLVSNPHDLYGYLMNQRTAAFVGRWA
jgi:hypothetical protein